MRSIFENVCIFLSAVVFALSFFLFDSVFSKSLFFPYPFLFYGMAMLWMVLVLCIARDRVTKISLDVLVFFVVVGVFVFIGTFSSLISQKANVYSVGSKIVTLLLSGFSFYVGWVIVRDERKSILFARYFLFSSLALALWGWTKGREGGINYNWVSIMLLFSLYIYIIVIADQVNTLKMASLLFLLVLVSFRMFLCRGVALSAGVSLAVLLVYKCLSIVSVRFAKRVVVVCVVSMVPLSVVLTMVLIYIYRTPYYVDLSEISRYYTAKSLDSSRLISWHNAFCAGIKSPIWGWGIGTASDIPGCGPIYTIHNLWIEYFFRLGMIGVFLVMIVYLYFAFKVCSQSVVGALIMAGFVLLSSVYDLGGFTHWPGTFALWFVMGMFSGYSEAVPFFRQ